MKIFPCFAFTLVITKQRIIYQYENEKCWNEINRYIDYYSKPFIPIFLNLIN